METTYYDTPDGALSARRWMLRRRLENGVGIVCVKTPLPENNARGEWQVEAAQVDAAAIEALLAAGAPQALRELDGSGFCAAPLAELSDGQMDLVLIPSVPRMQMLGMIDCYRRGKHLDTYDFIHFERCRRVRILADKPVLMNLDGEILRLCSPTVSVEPGALRLVIPREPDENT